MGRSLPEWIGKTDDTPVPKRVRVRVFDRDNGQCQSCGRKIRPGDGWETDHDEALCNGGQNRETNLQTLCEWCHRAKSAEDVAVKAQTYKTKTRHLGIKKRGGFRGWKRFNGEIVWSDK